MGQEALLIGAAAAAFALSCSSACSLSALSGAGAPPPVKTFAPTAAPPAQAVGGNRIKVGEANPISKTLPPGGGTGNIIRTTSSYHPDFSTNACGVKPDPSGNNAAISPSLCAKLGVPVTGPGSATCGRKLLVTNARTKQSVTITVLDRRGDEHGLDMETAAFNRIDSDKEGVKTGKHANLTVQWAK
jgi:hypothetical protein